MYHVTVIKGDDYIVRRKAFDDYGDAFEFLLNFYKPKIGNCILEFTTKSINGKFSRTYTSLYHPEELDKLDGRYEEAVKAHNAFSYDHTYHFLIESDIGVKDADAWDSDTDE